MKRILFTLFIFLVYSQMSYSQKDTRAELVVRGATDGIFVTPSENIWIATRTGNTYFTENASKSWQYGYFNPDINDLSIGKLFDRINFFNDSIGFISGFISDDESRYDFIYRTEDSGKTWHKIKFEKEGWIDATYSNDSGKAWLASSAQVILYSEDDGLTWVEKTRPEATTNQRIVTIHFLSDHEGIAGTTWNKIYFTKDNCMSWDIIKTPLDQKKYVKVYPKRSPRIEKLILTEEYIIVKQEDFTFYSSKDTIDWKPLAGVIDFEYDKSKKLIYLIDNEYGIYTTDDLEHTNWDAHGNFNTSYRNLFVQNGKLFIGGRNKIIVLGDTLQEFPFFTEEHPIDNVSRQITADTKTWGCSINTIYKSDDLGKSWYRVSILDFAIRNFKPLNDTVVLISDYNLNNHYLFNSETQQLSEYKIPNQLSSFEPGKLSEIILETGSQGCFHSHKSFTTFSQKGDHFHAKRMHYPKKGKMKSKKIDKKISYSDIETLLVNLTDKQESLITIKDFNIKDEDIVLYNNLILDIENGEFDQDDYYFEFKLPYDKVDFDFFKRFPDQLNQVSDRTLRNVILDEYGNYSTTLDWDKMILKNKDEEILEIYNSNDFKNSWNLPWTIRVNQIEYKSINPFVGQFYINNFNAQESEMQNAKLIFQLAKYSYERKLVKTLLNENNH